MLQRFGQFYRGIVANRLKAAGKQLKNITILNFVNIKVSYNFNSIFRTKI